MEERNFIEKFFPRRKPRHVAVKGKAKAKRLFRVEKEAVPTSIDAVPPKRFEDAINLFLKNYPSERSLLVKMEIPSKDKDYIDALFLKAKESLRFNLYALKQDGLYLFKPFSGTRQEELEILKAFYSHLTLKGSENNE
ncbi:MAG: hypothetical protein K5694_07350, partial [Bacilli bacterium]|nr:hypothetical protein [Bacilli bacterium]